MKKRYIRSTTKAGIACQTEVTWGQWLANRIATGWAWLTMQKYRALFGPGRHF